MNDIQYANQHNDIDNRTRQLAQYWEGIHDEAEGELTHLGFVRLPKPGFTAPPIDPKALATMNLVQYAEVHLRYQAWVGYSENTLAYIKSMLIGVKRQMEEIRNDLVLHWGKQINPVTSKPFSADDRKSLAESNPRYLELLRDRTKLESQKELTESYLSAFSGTAAVISRHIELRKLDIDAQRANNNMPGRGMYSQT
jgi:hypothetical protein